MCLQLNAILNTQKIAQKTRIVEIQYGALGESFVDFGIKRWKKIAYKIILQY